MTKPAACPPPEVSHSTAEQDDDAFAAHARDRLRSTPPQVGAILITVGVAGVILPGPIGLPFVVAGCFVLWPKTVDGMEWLVRKRFPKVYHYSLEFIERYFDDLDRRFPGTNRPR